MIKIPNQITNPLKPPKRTNNLILNIKIPNPTNPLPRKKIIKNP